MELYNIVTYCVWLLSLSTIFLRFNHNVPCISISLLFMAEKYSFVYHNLSIYPLMYTLIISIFWLLWIVFWWTWMYKYLFKYLLSILGGMCLEVEMLGHMVIFCLAFWGTIKLFSTAAASFYIPTSKLQRFQFLHLLTNTCYFQGFFWLKSY